ncbi:putative toxin-antitoxin system toxin component, PIN family [Ramlibacter sp. AN1015]|uniref:putative toxin-antitoxin system toxin component, PIN family n=1 Tax=Ramlibacter sp. AN1015 TaxID=3133428 RepID=UPI004040A5E9
MNWPPRWARRSWPSTWPPPAFTADQLLASYRRIATMVTARQLDTQVSRDADDDAVLACALAARANLIVSGDDDLLVLIDSTAYTSSPPLRRPSRASPARPSPDAQRPHKAGVFSLIR